MTTLYTGIETLKSNGLNLVATLHWSKLPAEIRECIDLSHLTLSPKSLILIGHGGKKLWSMLPADQFRQADPIDSFSREKTRLFADTLLGSERYRILFPDDQLVPLQQLGHCAGWHHPSPLGVGINSQWGLWFAYRAVLVTDIELPEIKLPPGPNPCQACHSKPCTTACPSLAVTAETGLDLKVCTAYRLEAVSDCAEKCLARLACPVATEHRYTPQQVQYHYLKSLETLQLFYGK
ncbi:MAG: hypothetical protein ABW116_05275 [Candidatus Sedimenticola sp. 20ELBAFRAG]